ncbi:hypothetical protein E1J38_011225 [Seonamhaeicola sediminis]|uniref:Uncharacterized protein n=1 Tax=Seonamhaeicola sediminis TaxID=2528206 RepID=A0A562YBX6_9FLAO|nr:hypothetical protein [Seonamhaeicola sediminis]TWO31946.1 hypothetical protein E1J38_011225 [Seonamhaeicola sediminis]
MCDLSASLDSSVPEIVDNSNYYLLDESCSVADTNNCQEVTRKEYVGSGCKALCQKDADGNSMNCQEVCTSYIETTITSYHGGDCTITPSCIAETRSHTIPDISVDEGSCQQFGECNQFGCGAEACGEFGCGISAQYFEKNTVCSEEYFCNELDCDAGPNDISDSNLECFLSTTPQGNALILNVTEINTNQLLNTYFRCNPENSIEQGDPWCESSVDQNIVYNPSSLYCEYGFEVCDYGSSGITSTNGCSDILQSGNDYWQDYNQNCVETVSVAAQAYAGVYDQACCYAYTINNYDIYDDALTDANAQNGIRVY